MTNISRRAFLKSAVASAIVAAFNPTLAAWPSTLEIDRVLRRGVDSGKLAGVTAVAGTASDTFYSAAFGQRTLGLPQSMSLDSVFWVASMTKTATSMAAMQLVERGALSLHNPISSVLPELATPQVLEGFDASGKPRLRPAKGPITLHHLLTHTSGFSYPMFNADNVRYAQYAGIPDLSTCLLPALRMPLVSDPGTAFVYGISLDWVGQAIERVSGMRLEEYFRENIFKPAGMKDTGFILDEDRASRTVGMHARQPDGTLTPIPFLMEQHPEFYMGGGGLYSTAPDYLKLTQIVLNNGTLQGNRILKPESVKALLTNQIGSLDVGPLKGVVPALSNDIELLPGITKKWSYGFMLNETPVPSGRSAGSAAWAGLSNCYFWIDPKKGVASVILMQVLPFADEPCLKEFGEFETAVYRYRT